MCGLVFAQGDYLFATPKVICAIAGISLSRKLCLDGSASCVTAPTVYASLIRCRRYIDFLITSEQRIRVTLSAGKPKSGAVVKGGWLGA